MKSLNKDELQLAFHFWYSNYKYKDADRAILPFLSDQIKASGQSSWLRKARQGLLITLETAAEKIGITRAAYSQFEEGEEKGTIALATLAKAAEALDCELVYAIRPKKKQQFSQIIWNELLQAAMRHPSITHPLQKRRGHALAAEAQRLMQNTKFRKSKHWSKRKN